MRIKPLVISSPGHWFDPQLAQTHFFLLVWFSHQYPVLPNFISIKLMLSAQWLACGRHGQCGRHALWLAVLERGWESDFATTRSPSAEGCSAKETTLRRKGALQKNVLVRWFWRGVLKIFETMNELRGRSNSSKNWTSQLNSSSGARYLKIENSFLSGPI